MTLTDDLKRSDLYERAIDAIFMEDRPSAYWVELRLLAAGVMLVDIKDYEQLAIDYVNAKVQLGIIETLYGIKAVDEPESLE